MAFVAWCFPRVGPYHTFLGSTVGFLSEPLGPTVEGGWIWGVIYHVK